MEQKELEQKVIDAFSIPFGIYRIAIIPHTVISDGRPYSITLAVVEDGLEGKQIEVKNVTDIICNLTFPSVESLDNTIKTFQNYSDNIKKGIYGTK